MNNSEGGPVLDPATANPKEPPRAFTKEEVRLKFLKHLRAIAMHWAQSGSSKEDATDGLVFSILATIDGSSMALPGMCISVEPHPDDEEFCKGEGENWFEQGMVFNDDACLHEMWNGIRLDDPKTLAAMFNIKDATALVPPGITPEVIWTDEECYILNAAQHDGARHPYTCGNNSRHRPLIATRYGWKCCDCTYTQRWSHETGGPKKNV